MKCSLLICVSFLALTVPVVMAAERGYVFGVYVWAAGAFYSWALDILALRPGSGRVRALHEEIEELGASRRSLRKVIEQAQALLSELGPRNPRVLDWLDSARVAKVFPLPHIRDRFRR
jgi:hypothetical protein